MKKKVLIIDGASSGRELALSLINNGHEVYHMTSGAEESYNITPEHRAKYLSGMTDGVDYIKCFNYDTSKTAEENAELLRPYGIEAVIPGTESGVYTSEKICRALGLKGNDPETSYRRRDKYYMQKALKEAGIRSIDMLLTSSCDEAIEFFRKQRNGRMIIKPCSSAGSEMVFLCNCEDDIRNYFEEYLGKKDFYGNVNDEFLIQEYISGTEYVANSVSRNGKHLLAEAYEYKKINTGGDGGFFLYDRMILLHDVDDYPLDYINAALDAVGIEYGVSHMEFKVDDRGPVMIEVAARPMGESCREYNKEALGYDITELILDAHSSDEDYEKWYEKLNGKYDPAKYYIVKIVISILEGKLKDIPAYKNIAELKTVRNVNLIKALKKMELFVSDNEISSPGEVYLLGDSWEDVNRDAETIYDWERNHPEKLFTLKEE